MNKDEIRAFALTKAMEFSNKPTLVGEDEDQVLGIAQKFYDFLTFNEDKFGLKQNARQATTERNAKAIINLLEEFKYNYK